MSLKKWFRSLIGTRAFYRMVVMIALPIIVQNSITSFVNLLDNLMVGRLGTEQMSGVAVANQLVFVYNLTLFGAVSGAGIFSAQFYGAGDYEGVRSAFRYKLLIVAAILLATTLIILTSGRELIMLYLSGSTDTGRVSLTLDCAYDYIRIILIGLYPFALSQCYSSTMKESGQTTVPMLAGVAAVLVNLTFNYLLIYGKFGFPELGVEGAAIATVMSRFVECAIMIIYCCTHKDKLKWVDGLYSTLKIPAKLVKEITVKGFPLLANECLWSMGLAYLSQIYSLRGIDVVAAVNIQSTAFQLFDAIFLALGSASSIIVGQTLGAGKLEKARDYSVKLQALTVWMSIVIGVILYIAARYIPYLYNTSDEIRLMATDLLRVMAVLEIFRDYVNTAYFIIRSGGKTIITFLFDSAFTWVFCVPIALVLTHFTTLSIVWVFFAVQCTEIIKAVVGYILLKRGIWVNNITKTV
jgi:putative MATE family efflux protein